MTRYIIELYAKGQQTPYNTFQGSLPNGFHPTYADTEECFDKQLSKAFRIKVRYRSNGGLVAISYRDTKNRLRLRWN